MIELGEAAAITDGEAERHLIGLKNIKEYIPRTLGKSSSCLDVKGEA